MSSRLDRLLLLLDTGSSTSVRTTAAKQLAQLAVKSVTSDITLVEDDVKSNRQQVSQVDRSAWNELMSVVARILPFLHSKSFDTRIAASVAVSQICSLAPLWTPSQPTNAMDEDQFSTSLPIPDFPAFSVQDLISQGNLLLASSGKEFTKPTGIFATTAEVKKARKEAMGRLGLDFLDDVADDIELDKELAADMEIDTTEGLNKDSATRGNSPMDICPEVKETKKADSPPTRSLTPVAPSPTTPSVPDIDLSALSARERNRLKRKRKQGNGAFVAAPPPQAPGAKFSATPSGSSSKARLIASDEKGSSSTRVNSPVPNGTNESETVIVDPTKGGAISPKESKQSKALEVEPGHWIWDGMLKVLEVDLFSAAWEIRHGAALALRELLKIQGKCGGMRDDISANENDLAHEKWCNDLAAKFLCVFVLDRFGDFVSDQVVAPVRETVSQTMASLMLHMPRRSLLHVHQILLQMILQDVVSASNGKSEGKKLSVVKSTRDGERNHVWEVRHAGLLGIKYEVAVRSDLFDDAGGVKQEEGGAAPSPEGQKILRDVVDAAILGLGDRDDDVRSVAATCLLPVAQHLVDHLPESLERILVVLWHCLSDMKDDLSSSVGAVMDLLGKLVAYEKVINILASETVSLPLSTLAPTLFPFFRHTIPNVRLAVVKTLASFMAIPNLPRDWVSVPFLCLLYQNLICEERSDIRDASLSAWRDAFSLLSSNTDFLPSQISQQLTLDWYSVTMTPIGIAIDTSTFYLPSSASNTDGALERHNVDKNMLAQDLSLVPIETIFKARVATATALAYQLIYWPKDKTDDFFRPILVHYVDSSSMLQKFLGAIISEEWARGYEQILKPSTPLVASSTLAKEISQKTLTWLQGDSPPAYHEMAYALGRVHAECIALLQLFNTECKLPMSSIPFLGNEIDITGTRQGYFTIETAQQAVNLHFTRLRDSLGRTKKKEQAQIGEKRDTVIASIDRYLEVKTQYDIRVSAAFAAAFVAFKDMPDKVSPVVKGIMNGIKSEENVGLQQRSAVAVASFIEFCSHHNIKQPPDKIVKNLCTFLCQDTENTPTFAFNRKHTDGILSFQGSSLRNQKDKEGGKPSAKGSDTQAPEENKKARLSRRGAGFAFNQLSAKFGPELLSIIPNMWHSMAGGLMSAFQNGSVEQSDILIEKQYGQDVIDSLSVLEAVAPAFDSGLWPRLAEVLPILDLALRSRFAIIRQAAARCFATICDVMTAESMRYVVEKIVPLLGDPLVLANRQGATELIYHIVQRLDIRALPYVIFLVVPVLGRMSDSDDDIRSTSTNIFASLVKMVPLEAGLPNPPGFPDDLLKKRDAEREFLSQLLDGSKVAKYDIPILVKADLRKYQQEGVNWLAFLAKYQLHGILCDDMGLGKTLQSICILASKHHERTQRYRETKSPDVVHLPSLIICPPTLTGHWYYEILKYVDNLKPVLYTGNSRERTKLIPRLHQYDVVITSYEVVRNDIANLEHLNWLYCILDEGHVIKNAKTKLTKAVKCIRAQHRLVLSGTPIQNNVLELWSLFDFLMPGFLGTETSFNERFGKPILANRDGKAKNSEAAALALEALHKQVLPFLLRRLKEDVLNDLPPKIIQDYYCELSELQKYLYDDFSNSKARVSAEDSIRMKSASSKEEPGQQHIFQSLQYLRKLCNHPALVLKTDQTAINTAFEKAGLRSTSLSDIHQAPKLLALRQLLTDCGIGLASHHADSAKNDTIDTVTDSNGAFSQHRVLIFCQMKQMLNIIETDLFKAHMPSVTYMRLDGSTEANKRHAIVQTFNSDPSIDCLLLTTHVGGLGLTLTGADTVIFVEHDWNPMKDLQAMDRAHRIGQKKVVNVYRLITKGTLEEKIMGLQRFKLNIANSIVTQQNSGLASMDTDLVLDLFRCTTEEEDVTTAAKKAKDASKPVTQKNVLQGLEDLPAEEEYEGLDLSTFMGSLSK
ncbi:SNF2 superfamily chromatin remodeling protein [Macrolepiota fuliginosa MF-IS2]|uniref:TATA-binding protein-associated factor mot1 n=1 Tax=Macrolepiota fuliginosa MF-IS2 TaxID=1400762 RepID=A0A9P6C9J8_9AGAR|nr:SNF2 superfamily chromatin remodeling protein [Macrolepiota fuliginosa MF-IS2]